VGLIVAIDDFAGRRVFTIDDSSGACIEVLETLVDPPKPQEKPAGSVAGNTTGVAPQPPAPKVSAYPDIDVGQVVDVKGGLSEFRDERQIIIEKLVLVRSTMEEVILWEKRTKFRQDVLQTPWEISAKDLRKARKEAERDMAKAERKKVRNTMSEDPKVARYGGTDRTAGNRQKEPLVQQPVNLRELLQENKGKFKSLGL
jgi:endo-1,3(4)-beta-glucanase